nr:hypothetical protein BaRGS_001085 [Batillaria attramentaria]
MNGCHIRERNILRHEWDSNLASRIGDYIPVPDSDWLYYVTRRANMADSASSIEEEEEENDDDKEDNDKEDKDEKQKKGEEEDDRDDDDNNNDDDDDGDDDDDDDDNDACLTLHTTDTCSRG